MWDSSYITQPNVCPMNDFVAVKQEQVLWQHKPSKNNQS